MKILSYLFTAALLLSTSSLTAMEPYYAHPFEEAFTVHSQQVTTFDPRFPLDETTHWLSYLDQKSLLAAGHVSQLWRKGALEIWQKRVLDLTGKKITEDNYTLLASGFFQSLNLKNVLLTDDIFIGASKFKYLDLTCFDIHDAWACINVRNGGVLKQTYELANIAKMQWESILVSSKFSCLNTLILNGREIGHEVAGMIKPANFPCLTTLDLSNNRIGYPQDHKVEKIFSTFSTLTTLIFQMNYITETKILTSFPELTTLDLSGNEITDAGLESLQQLPRLTTLDLASNQITDAGLESLQKLPMLTKLDLRYSAIKENELVEFLQKSISLKHLTVKHSQISAKAERDMTERNPHLTLVVKDRLEEFSTTTTTTHPFNDRDDSFEADSDFDAWG